MAVNDKYICGQARDGLLILVEPELHLGGDVIVPDIAD